MVGSRLGLSCTGMARVVHAWEASSVGGVGAHAWEQEEAPAGDSDLEFDPELNPEAAASEFLDVVFDMVSLLLQ